MSPAETNQTFHFRAGAPDGGVFTGQLKAGTSDEVLLRLRQRGFVPLRIGTAPLNGNWLHREIGPGQARRLSIAECEAFCRELALLLGAELPVSDALAVMAQAMARGSRPLRFATALRRNLRLGGSLAGAAESCGFALPADFLPVLRAGEESGSLPAALTMLAEAYAEAHRFARTWSAALAYPVLLLVVAGLVLLLLAFFVAPSLAGLFVSMDRPMPFAIAALSSVAATLSANPLAVGLVVVLVSCLIGGASASPPARAAIKALGFRLPIVGPVLAWSASRRFASTLRLYLKGNIAAAAALPSALTAAGFPRAERRSRALLDAVRAGGSLTAALAAARIMPPKLVQMIGIGESSGRLTEMLGAVVAEARSRLDQRMALLSALLAPVLILVVGGLIGTIIYSVFSALLELNEVAL